MDLSLLIMTVVAFGHPYFYPDIYSFSLNFRHTQKIVFRLHGPYIQADIWSFRTKNFFSVRQFNLIKKYPRRGNRGGF
jgi:hypothetical protein